MFSILLEELKVSEEQPIERVEEKYLIRNKERSLKVALNKERERTLNKMAKINLD